MYGPHTSTCRDQLSRPYKEFFTILSFTRTIFYLHFQIQLGEELLAAGDLEAGVEHLGQAVAVCGQTQQLLSVSF